MATTIEFIVPGIDGKIRAHVNHRNEWELDAPDEVPEKMKIIWKFELQRAAKRPLIGRLMHFPTVSSQFAYQAIHGFAPFFRNGIILRDTWEADQKERGLTEAEKIRIVY